MGPNAVKYANGTAFVDGELVPIAEAKISLLDWGFLHSDATYDVAHVWRGAFFRLDDHIERFFAGMDGLRMSIPLRSPARAVPFEQAKVRWGQYRERIPGQCGSHGR